MLYVVFIAMEVASQVAAADAKRRKDAGIPPAPPPPPPTWLERLGEVFGWALILSPALAIPTCVGMAMYVVIKIAFAKEGLDFP
jgi:hypothetical protein